MEIRRRSPHTPPTHSSPCTLLLLLCIGMAMVHNVHGQNTTAAPDVTTTLPAVLPSSEAAQVLPTSTFNILVASETTSINLPTTSSRDLPTSAPVPSPSPSSSPPSSSSPPPSSSTPTPEVTSSQAPLESPTTMTTTETTTTSDTTTMATTSAPSSGLPMGAIIGIAAGGGAVLIVVFCLLICLCCCCCRTGNREDYKVAGPWMTVRHWDPRSSHTANMERSGSMLSKGSRSASIRSSISSIGSIIRFGSKRRSGKKAKDDGTLAPDAPAPMTVTPL